ncbi:hypothetical protein [Streptomyces sp. ID05-04B]|uniref:hypothetical protein n=1 Tax=Streptomyces sp. ID05-04B TaxID=3028661 RepID=UPI0029CA5255|nr:hypothetical protein [Streptomyces sp. ID05-04B]
MAAGAGFQGQDRPAFLTLREPGDPVVEVLRPKVVEDGPRKSRQLRGGDQAGGGERLEQRVVGAVDAEVAKGDEVGP